MKAHVLPMMALVLLLAGCEDAFMKWTHKTYFCSAPRESSGDLQSLWG